MLKRSNKYKKISNILAMSLILAQVPIISVNAQEENEIINDTKEVISKEYDNTNDIETSEIINIPDENLRKEINMRLNKDINSEVTKSELESIQSLYCGYGSEISNLEGLQYCINLETLSVSISDTTDVSILKELTNLELLLLGGNQISDITPLMNVKWENGFYIIYHKIK